MAVRVAGAAPRWENAAAAVAAPPASDGAIARRIVDRNFEPAAERLGLGPEERLLLRTPFREVQVEVPVRMDDGRDRDGEGDISRGILRTP